MNIKPHTKGLFTLVPIIQYITSSFQQKVRQEKAQSKETKKASEPYSAMTHIVKLLNREFKITGIDILRALKEKVDGMKE